MQVEKLVLVLALSGFPMAASYAEALQVGLPGKVEFAIPAGPVTVRNSGGAETLPDNAKLAPVKLTALEELAPEGELRRYRISFVAIQAGKHDLRGYLKFPENFSAQMVSPIQIEVPQPLPTSVPGRVDPVQFGPVRAFQVSRSAVIIAGGVWIGGLTALAAGFAMRARRGRQIVPAGLAPGGFTRKVRLAEFNLLTSQGVAELERQLLLKWRAEFRLGKLPLPQVIEALRKDERGKLLLEAFTEWQRALETGTARVPVLFKEHVESPMED